MKNTDNTLAAIQLNQVIEQLKQDDNLLMQAYCDYSEGNNYDRVYDNDEDSINMMFDNAYDALRATSYDYDHSHAYFTINKYGDLQSFDIGELAQWLIDEDKLGKYRITVTTLEDMLGSIEDSVSDDSVMLYKLCNYLAISYDDSSDIESLIEDCMQKLEGTVTDNMQGIYERLINIINHLNISYE